MTSRVTIPAGGTASPHPPKRVKTHDPPGQTVRKTQWQINRTQRNVEDFATDDEDEAGPGRIEDMVSLYNGPTITSTANIVGN